MEKTMPRFLLLYASTHGQTEKIASRICEVLRDQGVDALAQEATDNAALNPADFDVVLVAASVHAGHHQREVLDWVKAHAATLNGMPSAFVSVSLSAAEDTDESREANRAYMDEFSDTTGWTPTERTPVAGALQYLEYDFMTKLLMRLTMKRGHHPTDTSQDYEYTDWEQVESFARRCAAMADAGAGERIPRG
ncbi:MAG: flavodoxin domain-containing protein [Candidatus Limnocylindria bacterium]